ncbi:MAG: hypothetical protein NW237_08130 [Cyanobacteriota bacterium]|nr:hypothetical protein [Cyanobacteriota bacterium]
MAIVNPFSLKLEISKLFQQGQSFFALSKVESWLREHHENPGDFDITFHQEMPSPDDSAVMLIGIQLSRRDGQAVDPWLIEEINRL